MIQSFAIATAASGADFGPVHLQSVPETAEISAQVTKSVASSIEFTKSPRTVAPVKIASSAAGVHYSSRLTKYAELYQAIEEMHRLDEDDSLFIDDDTYRSACSVLNYLSYLRFPEPKVFAHGGDAAVFTWATGETSIHLTVGNGIAALGYRVKGKGANSLGYVDLSEQSVDTLFSPKKVTSVGTNPV